LLALDGGGIRGIITLEILIEIERVLAEATGEGKNFRLCNFFDYIAGTSTGAIIAAGLTRGMSVKEILDFYIRIGPAMFARICSRSTYATCYWSSRAT
jgi:patatin-like phospholipase/acyl hydrolase